MVKSSLAGARFYPVRLSTSRRLAISSAEYLERRTCASTVPVILPHRTAVGTSVAIDDSERFSSTRLVQEVAMIAFTCPGCGRTLRLKDEAAAGKKSWCPQCGRVVRIPAASGLAR